MADFRHEISLAFMAVPTCARQSLIASGDTDSIATSNISRGPCEFPSLLAGSATRCSVTRCRLERWHGRGLEPPGSGRPTARPASSDCGRVIAEKSPWSDVRARGGTPGRSSRCTASSAAGRLATNCAFQDFVLWRGSNNHRGSIGACAASGGDRRLRNICVLSAGEIDR